MKPRRVFVTLELETVLSLKALRDKELWHQMQGDKDLTVALQVQANVARSVTRKKKRRGKK